VWRTIAHGSLRGVTRRIPSARGVHGTACAQTLSAMTVSSEFARKITARRPGGHAISRFLRRCP
jgi:hypothetical protein